MGARHDVLLLAQEVLCLVHLVQGWNSGVVILLALTFRCFRSDLPDINEFLVIIDDTHWLLKITCVIHVIGSEVWVQHL